MINLPSSHIIYPAAFVADEVGGNSSGLYLQRQSSALQLMQTLWQLESTQASNAGACLEPSQPFRLRRLAIACRGASHSCITA